MKSSSGLLSPLAGFHVQSYRYADTILKNHFKSEIDELRKALKAFYVTQGEIIGSGGGEAECTKRLRKELAQHKWAKQRLTIRYTVEQRRAGKAAAEKPPLHTQDLGGESHEIDHIRRTNSGLIALEIEWNNKDTFFDRDLENFRRLHQIGSIKVGIIVTRGPGLEGKLRSIFDAHYGDTTRFPAPSSLTDCTPKQRKKIQTEINNGARLDEAAPRVLFNSKFGKATTNWSKLVGRVENRMLGIPCPLLLIGIQPGRIR